jgi:integrase/recombinase XerC
VDRRPSGRRRDVGRAPESRALIPSRQKASTALRPAADGISAIDYQLLVASFLKSRNPNTMRAYARGIAEFQTFAGVDSPEGAAAALLGRGQGKANALVLGYQESLIARKLAPATVNARIAAVKSLAKLGRLLGMVPWEIEVGGVKAETMKDTAGPGKEAVEKAVADLEARAEASPLAARNLAIVSLLYRQGLRRNEIVSLDHEHVDLDKGRISILGKGRGEREWITLSPRAAKALEGWIRYRGVGSGPLFTRLDRAGSGKGRLTGGAIWKWTWSLGLGRPHGVRHTAITDALDKTGGNLRMVQRFSRHRDLKTLMKYDDNRKDFGGEVAKLLD